MQDQRTAQSVQTTRLHDYASRLVQAVRVFKLPGQPVEVEPMDGDDTPLTAQTGLHEDVRMGHTNGVQV